MIIWQANFFKNGKKPIKFNFGRVKNPSFLPRKSSAEKWSASQTCRLSLAGILVSDSSQEKRDSFRDITIFSSATK